MPVRTEFDSLSAIPADTLVKSRQRPVHQISEAVVRAEKPASVPILKQTLDGQLLEGIRSMNVADALRYFAGLQLKDYGGLAGLKTVNIRSMGSQHLGVNYDGMVLGNAQNGQTDLGQLTLDNVEEISLDLLPKTRQMLTAGDLCQAASLIIRTASPTFRTREHTHLRVRVSGGTSLTGKLSTLWEQKLSERVSSSLSTEGLSSNGKYSFRYKRRTPDGHIAYDTTATRHNGDILSFRAEENLFGRLKEGEWRFKAYAYLSERGIPGAIVNNVWRRGERQWDRNLFVQGSVQQSLHPRLLSGFRGKYAYYRTRYVNHDETQLQVDNTYRQQEAILSTTHRLNLLPDWYMSVAYDCQWNGLQADMTGFSEARRWTHSAALATLATLSQFELQASLAARFCRDRQAYTHRSIARHSWIPACRLTFRPPGVRDLVTALMVKKTFRLPTFNDLYYADMGTADLKPEEVVQYNLGITYDKTFQNAFFRHLRVQADAYHNEVRNKIVAYPKGQQFRWTILNLGRVSVWGTDILGESTFALTRDLHLTARLQYTWQQARDITRRQDAYYRHQIPYIPLHSGTFVAVFNYRQWMLSYSFIYTGERYSQPENIRYNYVQPWYTHDLSLSFKQRRWGIRLDIHNLLGQDYEVIANYPMPRQNGLLTLEWSPW